MKTETREVYKCDHCSKMYQIKRYAEQHEVFCVKNPENKRACTFCPHLDKKVTSYYQEFPDGSEMERTVELFFCKEKRMFLYPPKVEIKKTWFELGYHENSPMPKDCDIKSKIDQDSEDYSDFFAGLNQK